ncbi:MAG: MoxR family ATPase, partial [Nitrospirae bacterium]
YPEYEDEKQALKELRDFEFLESIEPVVSRQQIIDAQNRVSRVHVDDSLYDYILQIVRATRTDERIRLGASTRGAQFLVMASKAMALINGRDYVVPDDVKSLAPMVLGHRIILKTRTYIRDAEELVKEITSKVAVPV